MTNTWAKIDRSLLVVNVEVASQEWVDEWTREHPDSEYVYRYANADLPGKAACIGGTYDEETTWFVPPSLGPNYTFDRELWEWVEGTP